MQMPEEVSKAADALLIAIKNTESFQTLLGFLIYFTCPRS